MPLDDSGIEQPLDPALKRALLESGGAFEALVGGAKQWEATRREGPILPWHHGTRAVSTVLCAKPDSTRWLVLPSFSGR